MFTIYVHSDQRVELNQNVVLTPQVPQTKKHDWIG